MKKLMIAAAAAAMIGGAYADGLCDEVIDSASCALYNVKFTFKTLAGKDAGCTAAQLQSAACGNLLANGEEGIAYLDNSTRKFEGILWQCKSACFEGVAPNEQAQNAGKINYVLWEKKYELAISPKAVYDSADNADPRWYSDIDEATKFDILGRYGKKAQKVTAFWTPSMLNDAVEVIYAAGFGSFDSKNLRIKSLSGNAVAKLLPINLKTENLCDEDNYLSVLAYMCSDFKSWCCCECVAASLAPASGTWSLKYNSSLSKKGKLSKIIPDYAYDVK